MKEPDDDREMWGNNDTATLFGKFIFWIVLLFIVFIGIFNK